MGGLEHYKVYVKFRNQTEPLPDAFNGTPSALDPLVEYCAFLRDNEAWEKEVSFFLKTFRLRETSARFQNLS